MDWQMGPVDEDTQHLHTTRVCAGGLWHQFSRFGLCKFTPSPGDMVFAQWWHSAEASTGGDLHKGFNTLVILVAWMLWKQCNDIVLNNGLHLSSYSYKK